MNIDSLVFLSRYSSNPKSVFTFWQLLRRSLNVVSPDDNKVTACSRRKQLKRNLSQELIICALIYNSLPESQLHIFWQTLLTMECDKNYDRLPGTTLEGGLKGL